MLELGITRIPVGSLSTVTSRIIDDVEKSSFQDAGKCEQFLKLKEASELYLISIQKRKNSSYSKDVIDKDNARDKVIISMKQNINSYITLGDSETKESAISIQNVLQNIATGIETMPYTEETSYIKKLITELKKPEYQKAVETLRFDYLIKLLEKANAEFEETFAIRTKDLIAINEVESATTQRKQLEKALRGFVEYINAMLTLHPSEELFALEINLQRTIDDSIAGLKRKRNKNTDSTDENQKE